MKMKFLMAVLAMGFAVCARAQIGPYAMVNLGHYSGLGVGTATNLTGSFNAYGGTFGVYDDLLKAGPLKLGADARLLINSSGNSNQYGNKLTGFLAGGRVEVNLVPLPFRPYGQVELGVVSSNNGTQVSKNSSFAYQAQFGADFTLLPHIAARAEYGVGEVQTGGGTSRTLQSLGIGIAVRL